MKKIGFLSVLLLLLLGACATAPTTLSSKGLPESGVASTPPGPDESVIEYTRSGGLAGKTETWIVHADGSVTLPDGSKTQIGVEKVNQLLSAFEAIGLPGLPQDTGSTNSPCNDCYTYQVKTRINGELKTYQATDAQPGVPETFWTALQDLNQALNQAQ